MRDIKLFTGDNGQPQFDIKLDLWGMPALMDSASQSQDQRAAVATVIMKGSIPGAEDIGVDWGRQYDADRQVALLDIDNQCKRMIEMCAADRNDPSVQYQPLYMPSSEEGITVITLKS